MSKILIKLFRIISSKRLALLIISLFIILCIPATIIPQNRTAGFYESTYPSAVARLITAAGFDHMFSSAAFLILSAAFSVNLASCTARRIAGHRKRTRRTFGADIIHLGLLILMAGAIVSSQTKEEAVLFLNEGDSLTLPSGKYLNITDFQFDRWDDGRPKDWITTVEIAAAPDKPGDVVSIEVNKPLRIDGLVIYQSGYRPAPVPGKYSSGLMINRDRGKILQLISFIITGIGFIWLLLEKRRKK